jgi:hypothetical protein
MKKMKVKIDTFQELIPLANTSFTHNKTFDFLSQQNFFKKLCQLLIMRSAASCTFY